jgi:trimeric autotransporter adhesin
MASIIQIKRSTGAVAPTSLAPGELAYSFGTGTQSNLGDRLFFGAGSAWNEGDQAFYAESIDVIGGKYFTAMLGAVPGTLTASSAIITDANSKISNIKVDNIDIDGNTISTTNLNGNLVLSPNGTGSVDVDGSRITSLSDPINNQDAATRSWVLQQTGSVAPNLTLLADTGLASDTLNTVDSDFSILGGTGLTTVLSNNTITINLDDTNVAAGTYGSATSVPGFTVDAQGRITGVTAYAIDNIDSAAVVQEITTVVDLEFLNNLGITASTLDGETAADFHDYAQLTGAPTNVSDFTNDAGYAVLANLTTGDVPEGVAPTNLYYTTARFDSDFATQTTDALTEGSSKLYYTDTRARAAVSATDAGGDGSLSYNSTTGAFTYTGPSATDARAHFSGGTGVGITDGVVSIGQAVGTTDNVTFGNITSTGDVVIGGNLQVNGTTLTVNSESISISDNMLYLNSEESDLSPITSIDVGWAANVNDHGGYQHVGFFRDATDETFKVYHQYGPEPDASVQIDTTDASFKLAPFAASTLTGQYLGFDSDVATLTTDDIAEGATKLYYTDARAEAAAKGTISVSGNGIAYDGVNGIITLDDATTTTKGVASFSSSDFTVTSGVVTVKAAGISNTQLVNSGLTLGTDATSGTVSLGGTLTIAGSGAISTNAATGTVTVSVATATDAVKGVASFASSNFTVVDGAVTTDAVSITGNSGVGASVNNGGSLAITATASSGVAVVASATGVAINVANATYTTKGTASFDINQFTVTSGAVTLATIDGGTF